MEPDDKKIVEIDEKLEELIALLSHTHINGEVARYFKQQFDHAVKKANKDHVNTHHELPDESHGTHTNRSPKKTRLEKYLKARRISHLIFITIDVIIILLGLGIIIFPTPQLKSHYISSTYGITVIDLISLLIILAGVYFLVRDIFASPDNKNKNITNFNR